MYKITITFISLVIVLIGSLLVTGYYWTEGYGFKETDVTGDTIEEALFNMSQKKGFTYGKIIKEVYVGADTRLIFHLDNMQYSLRASVVKKKWNGKWKVLVFSKNQLIEQGPGEDHPYSWGGFSADGVISGYWGFIYYENVERMVVKKNKELSTAELFEYPNLPIIWYKYFDADDQYIKYISVWPEDAEGNEIPWSRRDAE
jgi:hypothetical protein